VTEHIDYAQPTDDPPATLLTEAQLMALLGTSVPLTETEKNAMQTATALIQNYVDRMLLFGTYVERHLGPLGGALQLREYPVRSITSLVEVVDGVPTSNPVTNYRLVRPTGILLGWWGYELEVEYEAGYEKMPADLATAFVQTFQSVAASMAPGMEASPLGVVRRAAVTGVGSVEYDSGGGSAGGPVAIGLLPANAAALLAAYRAHGPIGVG
jgi:hypothetical protein